tara:strand:+ start:252 stop:911 length:660 start_codon:yes stop_codon:yes gene_type:complete
MDKILSIWKPVDMTSFDVIRIIKSKIKKNKIGHCGTLDPFAEGVLVVCMGKYTKKVQEIMSYEKMYKAKIRLGVETDTLDYTGDIINSDKNVKNLNRKMLESIFENFIGEIYQVPPYYSAKKINGVKLCDLARSNIFIQKSPSIVKISKIELESFNDKEIIINVVCGKGTYIRALCRDIAYKLNTYGYLESLERLQVGDYKKENSIHLKDLGKCLLDMN